MNILLTGGTGFVGAAIRERLARSADYRVTLAVRGNPVSDLGANVVKIENLDATTDWRGTLEHQNVVIHSAARVHVMHDSVKDPLKAFRAINVAGTIQLARQAAQAGVTRFIFISSIKVNGEKTVAGRAYTAFDAPAPMDPYGVSKMEAEIELRAIAETTGMEVVIIRPVLVYGPGVKANFRSMMNWLRVGVPLPLGGVHNKRSLVSLENLVDLIATCIDHPSAANNTFLVSDDEDLSVAELLKRLGNAMGYPARLISVPPAFIRAGAALLGKGAAAERLCNSLQVDISHTCETLHWRPPVSVDDALASTARSYLSE